MANWAKTKIYSSKGRNSLYLPSSLVNDDRFPFKVGQELIVKIEHMRLTVETPAMAEAMREGGERTTSVPPLDRVRRKR